MPGGMRARRWALLVVVVMAAVVVQANPSGADATWPVSGRVRIGGAGAPGVRLAISGGNDAETDADGDFVGTSQFDEGALHLRASASGVGRPIPYTDLWFTQVDFTTGQPFAIDLPSPATLTVRVREPDGTPVDDAYVTADHHLADVSGPGTLNPSYSGVGDIRVGDQTGPSGDVVLDEYVGTTDLVVRSYGTPFRQVELADLAVTDGKVVDVVLPGPVTVSGHVTLDGQPLTSAMVDLHADAGSRARAFTDATGTFSLASNPGPGDLIVSATLPAGTSSSRVVLTSDVEVSEDGGDQFDVDLTAPFVVPATVTDTTDAPVLAGVELSTTDLAAADGVTTPGPVTSFEASSSAATAADGTAEVAAFAGLSDVVAHADTSFHVDGFRFPEYEQRTTLSDQAVEPGDRFDLVLPALPGAPTNVVMDDSVRAKVTLSWSPPAEDVGTPITGYTAVIGHFQFGPVPSSPVYPPLVVTFGPDARSAEIAVASGQDTDVRLYATTAGGPGPAISERVHPPASLAGAPANVRIEPGAHAGLVRLRWDPPSEVPDIPITGYRATFPDSHQPSDPYGPSGPTVLEFGPDARSGEFSPGSFSPASSVSLTALTADGPGPGVTLPLPSVDDRVDVAGRRLPDGELIGDGQYGTQARQQLAPVRLRRGTTARLAVLVGNDGFSTQRFRIEDPSNPPRFRVRWFAGDRDVTAAVRAGTYWTPRLRTGQAQRLVAQVQIRRGTPVTTAQMVVLAARPENRLSQRDRVRFSIQVT